MKLKSFGAGVTGVALIAGSVLLGAMPASAATNQVILPVPIPAEADFDSYPAGWFAGTVSGADGTATQSSAGVEIVGGTNGYQLLNGDPADARNVTLAAATGLGVSTISGDAFYQISVFAEPNNADNKQFTTLRPVDPNGPGGNWVNSRAFDGAPAGTEAPLATHVALLDAGEPAQVLAFGVFVNAGDTVTVRAIGWDSDTYLFATAPTATATPSSVVASDTTTEVTLTGSGFAPGETVAVSGRGPSSSGAFDDAVADAEGIATVTFVGGQGEVGDYVFTFSDRRSGLFSASTQFSILAAPVVTPVVPAAVLPPTGVDALSAIVAASVLLAAGAGFILLSMRRKAAAQA